MKTVLLLSVLCIAFAVGQQAIGVCHISGGASNPEMTGVVYFYQEGNGDVVVAVNVSGVRNPGIPHGIHVHAFGDISTLNGTATGGHLNPLGKGHGCPETNGTDRHHGDMGNFDCDANGNIVQNKTVDLISLTGGFSIIGRAVTVHALTDDCVSQTSYGGRAGQCVIGLPNLPSANAAKSESDTVTKATCYLSAIGGSNVTGYVFFQQNSINEPTLITAEVHGLNGNAHGFHLHTFGDIGDTTQGLSTGGHFNPFNGTHSLPGYGNPHVGDLGNLYYYENGVGYYKFSSRLVNLTGVNNVIGRAIVIHSGEDVCTANYGTRIAQCVIGINGNLTSLAVPATVPSTQSNAACTASTTVSSTGVSTSTTVAVSTTRSASTTSDDDSAASIVSVSFAIVAAIAALLF
eukprot:TRINITY_DN6877_c0_g1_i1.p1 TRINITY_DN6877_c0_g1~~TRINITY_DN6877_c0_g1_i1.p1  ORF type:complete len:421 (-),score=213.92 TRINITY_DN6877_c0_g1_i1:62-1273(-)